jgi:hypothetical protein
MLLENSRPAITATCTVLIAAVLLVAGCGRSPVDPSAPSDKPSPDASADPAAGPADPGAPDLPAPATGGGAVSPGGSGGAGPLPAPAPGKPAAHSGLKPLPKVTPPPAFKGAPAGGGGADPAAARDDFSSLLESYGYLSQDNNTPHNIQMQLMPILRTPNDHPERLHWVDSPGLQARYDFHVHQNGANGNESFSPDLTYEQWKAQGADLAARTQNFSMYVARSSLYRSLLADRYHDVRDDRLLIFYKRLNRTPYAVSYRADGTIDDFCAYGKITVPGNRELFMAMPTAYYQ